jgi:hypothetical protein
MQLHKKAVPALVVPATALELIPALASAKRRHPQAPAAAQLAEAPPMEKEAIAAAIAAAVAQQQSAIAELAAVRTEP